MIWSDFLFNDVAGLCDLQYFLHYGSDNESNFRYQDMAHRHIILIPFLFFLHNSDKDGLLSWKTFEKEKKNSQSTFPNFHNRDVKKSYWKTKENVAFYKNKDLVTHSLDSSLNKNNSKVPDAIRFFFFNWKKLSKAKWGTSKENNVMLYRKVQACWFWAPKWHV